MRAANVTAQRSRVFLLASRLLHCHSQECRNKKVGERSVRDSKMTQIVFDTVLLCLSVMQTYGNGSTWLQGCGRVRPPAVRLTPTLPPSLSFLPSIASWPKHQRTGCRHKSALHHAPCSGGLLTRADGWLMGAFHLQLYFISVKKIARLSNCSVYFNICLMAKNPVNSHYSSACSGVIDSLNIIFHQPHPFSISASLF